MVCLWPWWSANISKVCWDCMGLQSQGGIEHLKSNVGFFFSFFLPINFSHNYIGYLVSTVTLWTGNPLIMESKPTRVWLFIFPFREHIILQRKIWKKYTLGPRYWNVPVLVNTGKFLVYQYCLKMWSLRSLEHASVIQMLTILKHKNGLVLSNTRVPVSGTWSILFPKILCH